MDNIYIYEVSLPDGINEAVVPCHDGYTVYLSSSLSPYGKKKAYRHAMVHVRKNDFEKPSVTQIEKEAHR